MSGRRKMERDSGEVVITYGFPVEENVRKDDRKLNVRRIIYCVCASLSSVPYGLMLGWPSPTNPILLGKVNGFEDEERNSSITINWDYSAMIAGFLMLGNVAGTCAPFSSHMTAKTGLVLGNFTMVIGWVLMWQSASIPWLLASRFLTGTGYGFLLEHLKTYLTSTSEPGPSTSFSLRLLNSYSYVGVLLMYSYGSYVSMKTAAVISLIVSLSVLSVVLVLPGTESKVQTDPGLFAAVFRRGLYRERLGLVLLGTFQQFSGVPATIIYTQTVFERSGCPAPKEFSVLYAAVYLVANSVATFLPQSYDKRTVLVCSTLATSLAIVMYVTSIVIEIDASWSYASSVVLFVYLVAHTSGLGNVPVTFVGRFPEEYRVPIGRLFFAMNSLGALLVTKVFQVLMGRYGIEVPFCMFLAVSLAAFLYVYVCLDEEGKR